MKPTEQLNLHILTPVVSKSKVRLEMHTHLFIAGPRANIERRSTLRHSHPGGSVPHAHQDTGPASYTIDKKEWLATTGLIGGGTKVFTDAPTGEQFQSLPLEKWQTEFEIIVHEPPADFEGSGGALLTAHRMILGSRMNVVSIRKAT